MIHSCNCLVFILLPATSSYVYILSSVSCSNSSSILNFKVGPKYVFLWLQSNGTLQERLRLKRGIQNVADVGRVVSYKDQPRMAVWSGPKCNEYAGTDGSIFPPFLEESPAILAYAPDLCRYSVKTIHEVSFLIRHSIQHCDWVVIFHSYSEDLGIKSQPED